MQPGGAVELLERLAETVAPMHRVGKQIHEVFPFVALAVIGDDSGGLAQSGLPWWRVELVRDLADGLQHGVIQPLVGFLAFLQDFPGLLVAQVGSLVFDVLEVPDDGDGVLLGQHLVQVRRMHDAVLGSLPVVADLMDALLQFGQ